jgi:PIN domain of ribonuclease
MIDFSNLVDICQSVQRLNELLVVDFSRKTGDFSTLSSVDLKVLALTYMLEVEANGTARLRTEPVKVCAKRIMGWEEESFF